MKPKERIATIVAIAILVVFLVFVRVMLDSVDASEPAWSRMAYLFGGVEALAFAATGFLFGREVNRARAERAEVSAEAAQEKSEQAAKEAGKLRGSGQILVATLRGMADDGPSKFRTGAGDRGGDSALDALISQAEQVFSEEAVDREDT